MDQSVFRVVYWDSCIFISWLTDQARPPGEMEGIRDCIRRVRKTNVVVVTSMLTTTEVLVGNMPKEAQTLYSQFMRRGNVELIDMEPSILQLAKEIREFYQREKQAGRQRGGVAAADAIHLATAINREVDAFYTFDDGRKDKASLLKLNGDVAGHPLTICKPMGMQLGLF